MPPRLTYWTGVWDPAREAISKEIETLRAMGRSRAPVVSFAPAQRSALLPRQRVARLSAAHWLTLRAVAAVVEPQGEITHVFGGLDEWHLLRAVGRRPLLFTVVVPGTSPATSVWNKVSFFAAESESIAASLVAAGASADRVRVIYPGVDLEAFQPAPPPPGPFRLLFASSPADARELEARGVPALIELARRHPDIEVVLLWRRWGDPAAAARALASLAAPPNVIVEARNGRSMRDVYCSAHAVACCYAEGVGKSVPNSVVEGLACGRPALVTRGCGIASLICESGAGVVADGDPGSLDRALDDIRKDYATRARSARALAKRHFGLERFREEYAALYARIAAEAPTSRAVSRSS